MFDRYNLIKKNYSTLGKKYPNIHIGGAISWATERYKLDILDGKIDSTMCKLIDGVDVLANEGRNNHGIGFVEIEGVRYFVKYHTNLLQEFKNAYYISRLNERYPSYPYFLNVHALLNCNYMSRNKQQTNGHAMIIDMGTETVIKYMGRHVSTYMKKIIPGFEKKINQMDAEIKATLIRHRIDSPDDRNYTITDECGADISLIVSEFYRSMGDAFHTFRSDFLPKFLENYKKILDLFILLDILILNEHGVYMVDKKADNLMIRTERYEAGTARYIEVVHENTRILFDNTLEWDDGAERCYIYPVDFGSIDDIVPRNRTDQPPDISVETLNNWIHATCSNYLYSDDKTIGENNILRLGRLMFRLEFSHYQMYAYISDIFTRHDIFHFTMVHPLYFFEFGLPEHIEHMNTFDDALAIIDILKGGHTFIFDNFDKKIRGYSSGLSFMESNGIREPFEYEPPIYKRISLES